MLWTLFFFLAGVFIGAFVAVFFDFGVKIQFVTGKSAVPDWQESGLPRKPYHAFDNVQVDPRINRTR